MCYFSVGLLPFERACSCTSKYGGLSFVVLHVWTLLQVLERILKLGLLPDDVRADALEDDKELRDLLVSIIITIIFV